MIKKLLAVLLALFAAVAFAAVDVNKATQAELETVKGIGPAISGKIIEERTKSPFKDWNDMVERVKGVGDKNAVRFSTGGLTVNGAAFTGAPAAAPAAKKDDKAMTKADAKKPAPATAAPVAAAASAPMTADEKKAAKAKAKEDKAAAKAAAKAASAPASGAKK